MHNQKKELLWLKFTSHWNDSQLIEHIKREVNYSPVKWSIKLLIVFSNLILIAVRIDSLTTQCQWQLCLQTHVILQTPFHSQVSD